MNTRIHTAAAATRIDNNAVNPQSALLPGARSAHSPARWLVGMLLLAVAVAGCSKGETFVRAPVAGQVSVNGEPLGAGVVRFVPTIPTRGPATVALVKEGKFELPREAGPVVGINRIEIDATGYQDFTVDDEQAFAQRVQERKPLPANPIPPEYNTESKQSVELTTDGKLDFEFKIVSRTRRRASAP